MSLFNPFTLLGLSVRIRNTFLVARSLWAFCSQVLQKNLNTALMLVLKLIQEKEYLFKQSTLPSVPKLAMHLKFIIVV